MPVPGRSGMDVHQYLAVLWRRKWVIVLAVFVVVGSAVSFSLLQTPIYEAHARVLIDPNQSLFQTGFGNFIDPARVQTEIQVITSEPVRAEFQKRLGSAPAISASVVGTTAVLDLSAQSVRPAEASRVANAYAEAYVDYRDKRATANLSSATKELEAKIAELDGQIAEASARAPEPGVETPEQQLLRGQRAAFKTKLDQVTVDVAVQSGGAEVVAHALMPVTPINASLVRNGLLGLFVGVIVGTGLVFLIEQFDDSIKTKDDLERMAVDLPVLGVIPRMTGSRNRNGTRVVSFGGVPGRAQLARGRGLPLAADRHPVLRRRQVDAAHPGDQPDHR